MYAGRQLGPSSISAYRIRVGAPPIPCTSETHGLMKPDCRSVLSLNLHDWAMSYESDNCDR